MVASRNTGRVAHIFSASYYSFLVAPATLVFDGVGTIEGELGPRRLLLEIDEIRQERENDAPNYREAQEASASQVPESFDARTRPICY